MCIGVSIVISGIGAIPTNPPSILALLLASQFLPLCFLFNILFSFSFFGQSETTPQRKDKDDKVLVCFIEKQKYLQNYAIRRDFLC